MECIYFLYNKNIVFCKPYSTAYQPTYMIHYSITNGKVLGEKKCRRHSHQLKKVAGVA